MASSVFGRYDAVLVISAKDMDELSKTMYDVIEKHPNVEHSECLISIPVSAGGEVQGSRRDLLCDIVRVPELQRP